MAWTFGSRIWNSLHSVSKVQSSPRCPKPPPWNMSKGTALGCRDGSLSKANFAFLSMKRVINHADETRSMPGRGRVIHVRFKYSFLARCALRCDLDSGGSPPSVRASMASNRLRAGLLKKSMAEISEKRLLMRPKAPALGFDDFRTFFSSDCNCS